MDLVPGRLKVAFCALRSRPATLRRPRARRAWSTPKRCCARSASGETTSIRASRLAGDPGRDLRLGLVGPGVATIDEFRTRIRTGGSWLEPFNGFGPDNFLVGQPRFDFAAYRAWIDARFEPNRFAQIDKKLGPNSKFAVGAFIQALGQNPGLEQTLIDFGLQTHIYVGTGVGDIPTIYQINIDYYKAQRRWNRFWAAPQRCEALRAYLALPPADRARYRAEHQIPPGRSAVIAAERRWRR